MAPTARPGRRPAIPIRRAPWTRRTSATSAAGIARRALNARKAGFDIVYVYAGHDLSLPMHFLSRRHNRRSDEYGGSLENRCRLLRELIEETKDAVGDTCAVAVRLAVDELLGPDGITGAGEGREVIEMLAELPDLWDVNVSDLGERQRRPRASPRRAIRSPTSLSSSA